MNQVTFVILHYMALEATISAVNSILELEAYVNYKIVIIDNGSPNQTGKALNDIYRENKKIYMILLKDNIGFAAGNNVGYQYAKDRLAAEFIIVMNNDVELIQKNFIELVINKFKTINYYVLGPDIINLEGIHQSPQRNHIISKAETRKWLIKRVIYTQCLYIIKKFKILESNLLFKAYKKNEAKRINSFQYDKYQEEVELQGACFIFSPLYIKASEVAFEELSFMYGEEAYLAWNCSRKRWKIVYDPELSIKHAEKCATKLKNKNLIDKEIFYSENHVKAIKAILKKMNYYK